jgi:hypothetical protein
MRARSLLLLGALALGACAGSDTRNGRVATESLPPGPGRAILERECLKCHELDALALFSDFYGREQWRSLVLTMRDNGAEVDDEQVDLLAIYLARYFGTESDAARLAPP